MAESPAARTATLDVVGVPGCVGSAELARRVEDNLGRNVFVSDEGGIHLRVAFSKARGGWRAAVQTMNKGQVLGERSLQSKGKSCRNLDDELVLIVALATDEARPPSEGTEDAVAGEDEDDGENDVALEPENASAADAPSDDAASWHVSMDLSPGASWGLQPSHGLGVQLGLEVDPPGALGGRLNVWGSLPSSAELRQGASASLALVVASLQLCPFQVRGASALLSVCAGVGAGMAIWQGEGLDRSVTERALYLAANLQARPAVRLSSSMLLGAWGQAEAPITRNSFGFQAANASFNTRHEYAIVAASAGFWLGHLFE